MRCGPWRCRLATSTPGWAANRRLRRPCARTSWANAAPTPSGFAPRATGGAVRWPRTIRTTSDLLLPPPGEGWDGGARRLKGQRNSEPARAPEPVVEIAAGGRNQHQRHRIPIAEFQLRHVLEVHAPDARERGAHRKDAGPGR